MSSLTTRMARHDEEAETLNEGLVEISRWVDAGLVAHEPATHVWQRVGKVCEEAGEVMEALIGATGGNPRKGYSHTASDVEKELLDVAVSALAAVAHLHGNVNRDDLLSALANHVVVKVESIRAGKTA